MTTRHATTRRRKSKVFAHHNTGLVRPVATEEATILSKLTSHSRSFLLTSLFILLLVFLSSCSNSIERPYVPDSSPDLVSPTIIYLVRHAEKQESESNDPDLSEKGFIRAQALAQMLSKEAIDAVFSSDYQRTRNTLKPLAEEKRLRINVYDASDSGELVETILLSYAGKTVVVAGHSNTIPELVALLQRADTSHNKAGRVEAHLAHDEYDRIFVVVRYEDRAPTTLELSFPDLPEPGNSR